MKKRKSTEVLSFTWLISSKELVTGALTLKKYVFISEDISRLYTFCYIKYSKIWTLSEKTIHSWKIEKNWLTITESSFCFSFCIRIDVLATLTNWSAGDITELFCIGISEKLLMICGPFGAAVLSDELRSFTSSASCCATVKTTNINVSGEDLHGQEKKNVQWQLSFCQTCLQWNTIRICTNSSKEKTSERHETFPIRFLITMSLPSVTSVW